MQLKKEVETLQQKCDECRSKSRGGDSKRISSLENTTETLRKGLAATATRLDQFLSYQKKEHAQLGELHSKVNFTRDELTAWEVYYQQQPDASGIPEKQPEIEPVQAPVSSITTMAHQGDTKIEVSDPDCFPVGKYIVLQESLIYMVTGKGSLILDRPLSRDFLTLVPVSDTDADQYRAESTDIYLQNPQLSHSPNGERRNSAIPHGGNGSLGTNPHIEQTGLDLNSHSGNGGVMESYAATTPLPCGKPRPPIERTGTLVKELTLQTWLLRSHFQQCKIH